MSLKKNIVVSYISQSYVILVGILVLPFYIDVMGAETYGLVGFFSMLQSIFNLLDLGLASTISRETARFRAGTHTAIIYNQLFRTLNMFFIVIAIFGFCVMFFSANFIAEKWLNLKDLSVNEVLYALEIMAVIVALRWMTGLYRGVITGSEKIAWISVFNASITTFRFLIIFPVMWHFGATPSVFFTYQLFVAVIEFTILVWKATGLKPNLSIVEKSDIVWSLDPIKPYIKFALSISLTSGLWIIVTQVDKLIMSNLLSLDNYGYFTLAVLISSGIMLVSGPISIPILPRMVKLEAEGEREELLNIYRNSTQLITVFAGSVTIMLVFFSKQILWVWTGNYQIVDSTAPVMQLYATGYGMIAVSAFPYYLQYALGKLKLHIIGSILFVIIFLPILWFGTDKYGMVGAGYAWIIVNFLYFFCWSLVVHEKYIKGLHWSWLSISILKLLPLPIFVGWVSSYLIIESNRLIMLFELILIGFIVLISTALFSDYVKNKLIFKR